MRIGVLVALLGLWAIVVPSVAQELEPRAYRPLPVGLNFGLLVYAFSSGNVLVDPTAPVEGLELDINTLTAAYLRTFSLLGRSSSISVALPYVVASGSGMLDGERLKGSRAAPADLRLRMAVNLLGGPAMSPAEFARRPPGRSLGVGVQISAPTGQYNSKKLVNFGANRWGFKPEIGYSSRRGRWITDLAAGVWMFTSNDEFLGGSTKRQDPIGSFQAHLSYSFGNGMWLALNANYFTGGRSTIDGRELSDLQQNSRVGLTLSIPLSRRDSLKVAAHAGAYTRAGADFDVGSVAYQRRFGSPKPARPGPTGEEADPQSPDGP